MYYRDGMTQQEIADELGCSDSTVSRWMEKHELASKPWRDKETLKELLIERGCSLGEVADELGCYHGTIRRWVQKHDLYKRPWRDPEVLQDLFIDQDLSAEKVAAELGTTQKTVREYIIKHDLPHDFTTDTGAVTIECDWCDQSRTRQKHEVKQNKYNFCGKTCFLKSRRNWTGEEHPLHSKMEIDCANCGSTLERKRYRVENSERQFCGPECMGEWNSEHRVGERHPRFKGGSENYYGPNWNKQSRRVRDRDQHRCQDCGMAEPKHLEKFGRKLAVHHIRPIREFRGSDGLDYQSANKLKNLVTLCDSCHSTWERMTPLRPDTATPAD